MPMTEANLRQILDNKGISYTVRCHQPIYTVAEGLALGMPQIEQAVKSLLLTDDKRQSFYLILLPLNKQADLKSLRIKLQSRRLTMANAKELQELLGAQPGSATPLGIINDKNRLVQVIADSILKDNNIAVPFGSNTQTVWLKVQDLEALLKAYLHEIKYLEI